MTEDKQQTDPEQQAGTFAEVGTRIDEALSKSREWVLFSLILALLLYLVMWFIDDAYWHFKNQLLSTATNTPTPVLTQTLTTTPPGSLPSSPTGTITSTSTITQTATPIPPGPSRPTSLPVWFFSGGACGAIIVLLIVLALTLASRKQSREETQPPPTSSQQ